MGAWSHPPPTLPLVRPWVRIIREFKQGRSQKKLMTEAMSMEDLWPRQSVHGWVLFLGIKSVYNDYKQQKWKKLPRQVPRLACY